MQIDLDLFAAEIEPRPIASGAILYEEGVKTFTLLGDEDEILAALGRIADLYDYVLGPRDMGPSEWDRLKAEMGAL